MNSNTVKTLGAVTLLFCAGAWYAIASRASESGAGEAALPTLRERINDVASVAIETNDGTATLERSGDGWTLAEKGGYKAKDSKVREVLMALRGAEIVEQKTADPKKLPKLGLQEPLEDGSTAKRVTIKDDAGQEIASVLIGDQRATRGSRDQGSSRYEGQTYIHVDKGGPALLVSGEFAVDTRTGSWLDQQILSVPATRMKAVRVSHSDGEVLELSRGDMADADFAILSVPEGMEPKSPSTTRGFMSTLSGLRFDDVMKAADFEWPEESIATAEYFTEHGLRVTIRSAEIMDDDGTAKAWCTFVVDVVDPGALPGASPAGPGAGPPAPLDLAAPSDLDGEGGEAGDGPSTEMTDPNAPTAAELLEEAASLGAAVDGWVFALPSWKSGPVRMRPDGVLQAVPEPEPESEPEPQTEESESAPEPSQGDSGPGGDGQ